MATATAAPTPAESTTDVVCTLPPDGPVSGEATVEPWAGIEGFDRLRTEKMSTMAIASPIAITPGLRQPGRVYPEWHALRLFGRGRHPGSFESGNEREGDL
jgi:hypothetical protein